MMYDKVIRKEVKIMEKWTQEQYAARLQEMKQEAHDILK